MNTPFEGYATIEASLLDPELRPSDERAVVGLDVDEPGADEDVRQIVPGERRAQANDPG